jgi:cytochrome P450 / NADPH-cytochrome P450 reductase
LQPVPVLEPIPRPPGRWFVGNLFDIDVSNPVASLMQLARQYGPIYQLSVVGRGTRVVVSGYDLVEELCDDARFDKTLGPITSSLARSPVGRGLFTTETADPDWSVAHNILLPAFSMDAMRSYFPQMRDVAQQLTQKWERLNPDDPVDVTAEITRVTLDTIALCGFNYRFNSLYRDTPHPFVVAMNAGLNLARLRSSGLPDWSKLKPGQARRRAAYRELVVRTVQDIIDERRRSGAMGTVGDLLDRMLTGVDRRSGDKLDDGNIIA